MSRVERLAWCKCGRSALFLYAKSADEVAALRARFVEHHRGAKCAVAEPGVPMPEGKRRGRR